MVHPNVVKAAMARAGKRFADPETTPKGNWNAFGGKPGTPVAPPGDLEEAIAKGQVHPDVVDELRELEKERLERIQKTNLNDHIHPSMRSRLENDEYDEEYAQELREKDRWIQKQKDFMAADMQLGAYAQMFADSPEKLLQFAIEHDLAWALHDFLERRGLLDSDWLSRLEEHDLIPEGKLSNEKNK